MNQPLATGSWGAEPLAAAPCPDCGRTGWLFGTQAGRVGLADLYAALEGAILLVPTPLAGGAGPLVSCLACGWNDRGARSRRAN
jgi:hypothetical protein